MRREELGPQRRPPSREQRKVVLFSCEGAKTEPAYILALCKDLGLAPPQFAARGGDPSHVVECAVAEDDGTYDAVWCIFDRDEHAHFAGACQRAIDRGFGLAYSNPCIEVWYLLHYRYSTAPIARDDAVAECHQRMDGYSKSGCVYQKLSPMQTDAITNARRLREEHHAKVNDGSPKNPSTSVDLMVLALRELLTEE